MKNILIGTMSHGNKETPEYIRQLGKLGFESTEITFSSDMTWIPDVDAYAAEVVQALKDAKMELSSIAVYGNPLMDDEAGLKTRKSWEIAIDNASKFGTDLVCGFTGRVLNQPIPDSIPKYKEVWGALGARAKTLGVRIAFENCNMGGNWYSGGWNIAINPAAWELMFDAIDSENIGLEWEPAHQICQLIDPLPQLRKWCDKVFHVHGKDATVQREVIAEFGINHMSGKPSIYHRTPGFGETNWSDVISILRQHNYQGNIDIEGWHDPVYRGELEMTGQVSGMNYLKRCRGGAFIPNF